LEPKHHDLANDKVFYSEILGGITLTNYLKDSTIGFAKNLHINVDFKLALGLVL